MIPKPKHLNPNYAVQFKDESIVAAYRHRPPYPDEVFTILTSLIPHKPARILDVGCGIGNIARPLARLVDKVDAVDFSRHMLEEGKMLPNGDAANLNWIHGPMEEVPLSPPYALVTAGQSLHWMAWDAVFPRFRSLLVPGGYLAVIGMIFSPVPWQKALSQIISRYSTNRDFQPYDLFMELEKRRLFTRVGQKQTTPQPFRQTIGDYVESFHSRNGFSRQRMDPKMADAFDTAVHALVSRYHPDGIFEMQISGHVSWGIPYTIQGEDK
jgi:ubiquinone/menaquinone biosynthesis C-methylase UbiE